MNDSILTGQNAHTSRLRRQFSKDAIYIKMAKVWAQNSYCNRSKVGALIVKGGCIISDGYNGTPHDFDNECEYIYDGETRTKDVVLHAESNAITKLAKSTQSSQGSHLYVTMQPCYDCAKLIIQSGIKKVVYLDEYRDNGGLLLLKKANIKVKKLTL